MAIFTFHASLEPGGRHRWWTGGGDWYQNHHVPQFDVRPQPIPGLWPPDSDTSPALVYKDFACAIRDRLPYNASYYLTVENNSDRIIPYVMRVWVPE